MRRVGPRGCRPAPETRGRPPRTRCCRTRRGACLFMAAFMVSGNLVGVHFRPLGSRPNVEVLAGERGLGNGGVPAGSFRGGDPGPSGGQVLCRHMRRNNLAVVCLAKRRFLEGTVTIQQEGHSFPARVSCAIVSAVRRARLRPPFQPVRDALRESRNLWSVFIAAPERFLLLK